MVLLPLCNITKVWLPEVCVLASERWGQHINIIPNKVTLYFCLSLKCFESFSKNVSVCLSNSSLLFFAASFSLTSRALRCCPWTCQHRIWCERSMNSLVVLTGWQKWEFFLISKEITFCTFHQPFSTSQCLPPRSIFHLPLVAGAPLHANQDTGWLLLLRVRGPRATASTRPTLRGDGPGYDQHYTVSLSVMSIYSKKHNLLL